MTNAIQTRKVTPEEAKRLLALNNFQGQRPLNARKARLYADMILDGRMRPVSIAIMTLPTGERYLANGQHCLHAIIIANKPFQAMIEHYKCDEDADAWKLFGSFDVHPPRTERHIMKAAKGLFENEALQQVPLRVLSNCASALFCLGDGSNPMFDSKPIDRLERASLIEKYEDDVLWVALFSEASHLMKVAVTAAMIATYRANPKEACNFWQMVAEGGVPGIITKFRDRLLKCEVGGEGGRAGGNRTKFMYSECISYWNSYMRGEHRNGVKLAAMKEIPRVETRRAPQGQANGR